MKLSTCSRFTQSCNRLQPLGSRYLGYGLCDLIVVYNFGS